MEVIGRYREKQKLSEALESPRSELIAVYGRRRIGKTHLIRGFYGKHMVFSFTGLRNASRSDQLENFMIQLRERDNRFDNEVPKNWLQAFQQLKNYLKRLRKTKRKKVIFIDEFPWVDTMRSGFLPAFENFWNTYATTRTDLIIVVCGSAASYMIKKIIKNRGGLHNRLTRKIKLEPFTLPEVDTFFRYRKIKMPYIEQLKLYMALGGVAEYLEFVRPGDSSVTAIDRICFQKGAQLEHEFDEVFKSLFEEGSYHEQIIHALAQGPKRGMPRDAILNEQGLTSGGQFSKSLAELIECGFVSQYRSHYFNRAKTLYRIADEFCLFHLRFISPNKGNRWAVLYTKKAYEVWCGYAFEMLCYKHIEQIKRALRCDQIASKNYSWVEAGAQIDLVIDRQDNLINLCELKFYNGTFRVDAQYAKILRNKECRYAEQTGTRKGVQTIMLTTWGVSGSHAIGLISHNLTMDCLFEP
ncbi:AAA family ATPase [Sediminicola luteus]|uniref:ATPase domain-containing protein n=1 Tax=Sediminicola luteus TaxID=319238 RepID=A0A2A4GCT4_9FLAO|nr:ATP-binding protein [Sediminicola luteus]PCE65780.1 hypothetical protein B7P33_00290 [Sediminicola luteus]